uniref:X-ray radiation resistance-associated protein 1 n=1 Tax=Phallusia mammillata TaxID=59560 RepID=A0A6F9DXB4_9ASCI|nr:X-ray radiation resistance-associated protein 1 [Phallusia mammillata]
MAVPSVWKLETEGVFPTNCFPARGIARNLHEGSGSWVVAYAEEQENKFQANLKPTKHVKIVGEASVLTNQDATSKKDSFNTLDAKFLMQRHHVENPLDLCSVNVTDNNLDQVNSDDLIQFTNVAYVNAAENILPFRPFTNFVNLRELELPVNGLRNLQVEFDDFPNLQVLDLSYNNLSPQDLLSLGALQNLKVLTLTGNGLHSVPPDMARPVMAINSNGESEMLVRYKSLEVLLLDENHLSDLSTFAALAALPELRELNLDKNGIEVIPHLKVVGDKVVSETHSSVGQRKSPTSSGRKSRSSRRTSSAQGKKPPTSEVAADDSKRNMATSTHFTESARTEEKIPETTDSLLTLDMSIDPSSPNPPFKQLRLMSVANNLISEEECVLAVAAWPRLKHLVMHGNPIITNNNGEPSLISHYLRARLGINVHRFQPKAPVVKPQLIMPAEKSRKVSTHVPKIPKQPVDVLIKSLQNSIGPETPKLPPSRPQPARDTPVLDHKVKTPRPPDKPSTEDNVFLTQVDEDYSQETAQKVKSPKKEKPNKPRPPSTPKTVDSKYKGYEVLLDARPDSSLHEPVGIQGNVRALHHMLSHPTVFRSKDVVLNQVLPCYQPQTSRHAKAMAVARQRKTVKRPNRKDLLTDALNKLKTRDIKETDVPLTDALESKTTFSSDEAYSLLWEVEDKYRVVREESLKESRRAQRAFQETREKVEELETRLA